MPVKPFSPKEAEEAKISNIPDEVLEAVNELLSESYSSRIVLLQDKVINRVISKMENISRQDIFENKWLDFEPVYRKQGWCVEYDKPAYNDSYGAHWVFKQK